MYSDYFMQIVMLIAGALIGIISQIAGERRAKILGAILGVLLIVVSLLWIGYELAKLDNELPPVGITIADFENQRGESNLKTYMGITYDPNEDSDIEISENFAIEPDRGGVILLNYNTEDWAAFFVDLQGLDITPYQKIKFDIKSDLPLGSDILRVEIKRLNNQEVEFVNVTGITDEWKTYSIDISSFKPFVNKYPITDYSNIEEIVFVIDAVQAKENGVIYLDNIMLIE